MISRQSSNDSTRTFCPISERKLIQKRKNKHILLQHIYSKVLEHVRMEKFLEPYEVHQFIQQIKKLNTDQPDMESFRKKIRNMLLTINDSLMQFEQAVCSGEVALYSIDIGQNCDFTQQSSGTSVGEVPSFSSIELTNTDFMTVQNDSQNCIESDYYNTKLNMRKELPNKFICGHSDSKLNTVNQLSEPNIEHCEIIKIVETLSNRKYFKKPIKKYNKIKVNRSKINKVLLNTKNIHSLIHQEKKVTEATRKRKYDVKKSTNDLDQGTFSTELEKLHIDPSKVRVVCETEIINDQNELSKTLDSNQLNNSRVENKMRDSIDVKLNIQEVCSQTEPLSNTKLVKKKNFVQYNCDVELLNSPVEPTSGYMNENKLINCISYDIPETEISVTYPRNEEFISIKSDSKKKKDILLNNYTEKLINTEEISINNENIDNVNDCNKKSQQFLTNCQQVQKASSFTPTISDSTFFLAKNSISQKPFENFNSYVVEKYPLQYRKDCQKDIMPEIFIVSQDLFPSHNTDENTSTYIKLNLNCNEHIEKQLASTSDNLLVFDGELISQPCDNNNYNCQRSRVGELMKKNSEMKFEFRYGNIKKLQEKMALAKEDYINTWKQFIEALQETKNYESLEFQKEKMQISEGNKYHYEAMQKICDEYVHRFGSENRKNKDDDEYVPIESKMKKWCEFQDLVMKIKEKRKRKEYNIE